MKLNNLIKRTLPALAIVLSFAMCMPTMADFDFVGSGDGTSWEDVGNWLDGGSAATAIPGGSDFVTITGGGVNAFVDSDTWNYLVTNSLLTAGATGEYRVRHLRVGQFGTSTVNLDIGDGNVLRATQANLNYFGSQSGSNGTLNITSGDIRLEGSSIRIAEKLGSTGLINVDGDTNTRLIFHRESGGKSGIVGSSDGSNGTFQISGGKFRTRAGLTVGPNGLFRVLGTVTEVEIGSESSLDGNWDQAGTLEFGIDSLGTTQINIADKGGSGTFANFDAGSLLDLDFLGTAPYAGTWTLMEVENGLINDSGLGLAPGVDSGWSFNIDNSGPNGILTATYTIVPEPTALAMIGMGIVGFGFRRRR